MINEQGVISEIEAEDSSSEESDLIEESIPEEDLGDLEEDEAID